ncbi:MAG: hypothetical protein ACRC9L_03665 [Brevinema sp.]
MISTIASLFISIIALAVVLRERTRKPFESDLIEFRAETERLIAEFNRVSERNISMMDDRLEALERQIRIARKLEEELLLREEKDKVTSILPVELKKPERKKKSKKTVEPEAQAEISSEPLPEKSLKVAPEELQPVDAALEIPPLFDGFPVQRLRSYGEKRANTIKSHEQLLLFLKENKTKEELIDMGFSSNEINLAILSISLEENTSQE